MKVLKFGGAVLKNDEGIKNLIGVLKQYENQKVFIVISAFSKISSDLKRSANLAQKGLLEESVNIAGDIISTNRHFAIENIKDKGYLQFINEFLDRKLESLNTYLKSVSITEELSPRNMDIILSFGEELALEIIFTILRDQNFPVVKLDSRNFIVTDDNYSNAKPDLIACSDKLLPLSNKLFANSDFILTQGFVGASKDGITTTMGFESSNLTAAIIAGICKAEKLVIWTNVNGIRTADPELIENTGSIPSINYSDAKYLAKCGLKLIYPGMIVLAEDNNIPIEYRNLFIPEGSKTIISSGKASVYKMIISREAINLYTLENKIDTEILKNAGLIYYANYQGANLLCTKELLIEDQDIKLLSSPGEFSFITLIFRTGPKLNSYFDRKILTEDFVLYHEENKFDGSCRLIVKKDRLKDALEVIHNCF